MPERGIPPGFEWLAGACIVNNPEVFCISSSHPSLIRYVIMEVSVHSTSFLTASKSSPSIESIRNSRSEKQQKR
ncbi:hypothetical protein RB195_012750 [Necator americanus]|uniref:Uncharacterized protein n=1 Tax=Necator americanus TaxID=51031 RepID=A0ABR1DSE3_NECAM